MDGQLQNPTPQINLIHSPRSQPKCFVWIAGIIVAFCLFFVVLYEFSRLGKIVMMDQYPGRVVHVRQALLTRPGGIVIRRVSPIYGIEEVARTPYLIEEDYREFDVELKNDIEDLVSGDKLSAIIYEDANGDGEIDSEHDRPMRNIFGFPTRVSLAVR